MTNLPWIMVEDYKYPTGWIGYEQQEARARAYCELAERGQILFFRELPFNLPAEDQQFLREQEWTELRLHKNTLGRGALNAMKSGLRAARAPFVLITMGDASDDPADIDPMYRLASAGADVVAGSRYMSGGHQVGGPLLKRSMSRAAGLSLHWVGGLPIHDATSNFRLYSKRLLNQVTIESKGGFELGLELTVKAYRLGLRVAEVPTTWRDRTAGQSRFKLWEWLPRYLHWYWRGIGGRFAAKG